MDLERGSFDEFWASLLHTRVPRPVHKDVARRAFAARVDTPEKYVRMQQALELYRESKRVLRGFVQDASTWIRDWEQWETSVERDVSLAFSRPVPASDQCCICKHTIHGAECFGLDRWETPCCCTSPLVRDSSWRPRVDDRQKR